MKTFLRRLNILDLFRSDRTLTAGRVHKYLENSGDRITERSVLRLLAMLVDCGCLEVVNPDRRPLEWRLASDRKRTMGSRMNASEALMFRMVERFLQPLLPEDCYAALRPYLAMAERELNRLPNGGLLRDFEAKKVQQVLPALPGWPPLEPGWRSAADRAAADAQQSALRRTLLTALLKGSQCDIQYLPQRDCLLEWRVHPFVLVQCGRAFYLLGALEAHNEVRALALHRMTAVELRENKAHSPRSYGFGDESEAVQCFQAIDAWQEPLRLVRRPVASPVAAGRAVMAGAMA